MCCPFLKKMRTRVNTRKSRLACGLWAVGCGTAWGYQLYLSLRNTCLRKITDCNNASCTCARACVCVCVCLGFCPNAGNGAVRSNRTDGRPCCLECSHSPHCHRWRKGTSSPALCLASFAVAACPVSRDMWLLPCRSVDANAAAVVVNPCRGGSISQCQFRMLRGESGMLLPRTSQKSKESWASS